MNRIDELKSRIAQLDELIRSGVLNGAAARKAREDLEGQVLAAVLQPGTTAKGSTVAANASAAVQTEVVTPPSRRLLVGLVAFVLVFGVVGYAWLGNREGLAVAPGVAAPAAAEAADAGASAPHSMGSNQIEAMAERLAERLKTKPDDAEGWVMLGRSYSVLGRYPQALEAFKQVSKLRPKDAQALADQADALGMVNGRKLDGEPEKLVAQALKLDPDNAKALYLAGTLAIERGDAKLAVVNWERAMSKLEPGSDMARQLQSALDEARQRAGLPPSPATAAVAQVLAGSSADAPVAAAPGGGASVQVRVSLAPALAAKASPEDTVFIYARSVAGGKAPLAIQRRQVKDLPLELTLDESMAMNPAMSLATVKEVLVGARISKSGVAMPQPGDLQALSPAVAVGARGLKLEINEVIK